jgi:hypothetical protein
MVRETTTTFIMVQAAAARAGENPDRSTPAKTGRAIQRIVSYTPGMGGFKHAWIGLTFILAGLPLPALAQEAMQAEKKYSIHFETTQHKQYCKAQLWIEYIQRNTLADYNGGIINEDCDASSGAYTISVRYRDETGETHNIETTHTWERKDDQDIEFTGQTLIGENVDLIRVRGRKIQCVCAEIVAAAENTKN